MEPKNRKKSFLEEEQKLKIIHPVCCSYLDFIHSRECQCRQKPKLIRDLYTLSKKITAELFIETIKRALEYKVFSLRQIENIARNTFNADVAFDAHIPAGSEYQDRTAFKQGQFSTEAGLGSFQDLLEENNKDE